MASNYSKFSSVRVYRRYCFGAIFSGLLSLGVAGIFAGFLFMPAFDFTVQGGDRIVITGLQFVFYALRNTVIKVPQFYNGELVVFNEYMDSYEGTNQLLGVIKNIYPYVEYGLLGFLGFAVVFALVVGICGLVWILAGRIHNPKSTSSLTTASLVFFILFLGLTFLYFFFCQEIIKDVMSHGAPAAAFGFSFFPLIFAGGLLLLAIILGITYSAAFKNRVFAGRKKGANGAQVENLDNNNNANNVNNNNPSYGQPQPMPYQQMNNQMPYGMMNEPAPMRPAGQVGPATLPIGLKEIGDHAYSKCLSLKDATIPQGITDIGPSAFSNCLNLETVTIPLTVKEIGYNCFFNTPNLKKITYQGRVEDWKRVVKGSNWLTHSGINIVDAVDGKIAVNTQ